MVDGSTMAVAEVYILDVDAISDEEGVVGDAGAV